MTPTDNDSKAAPAPTKHAFAPEGASELPETLPDFPSPGTTDSGSSGTTTGK